jgi:cell division transport system ATP-binding protein
MIQFTNVFKSYENGVTALKGISFTVEDGEFLFIVGPSGSGKSTVMKLMTGEIRPSQGSVTVNNYDVGKIRRRKMSKLRRTLGIVFQDFRLLEKKTVYENVAFAMRIVGAGGREIRARVSEVLAQVGLEGSEYCYPAELSGGEQQRVAIARALVNKPLIIIADEPTGNIDPTRSLDIMNLLEDINNRGTTVLVVTHEKSLVDRMSKRVIAIEEGVVVRDAVGEYDVPSNVLPVIPVTYEPEGPEGESVPEESVATAAPVVAELNSTETVSELPEVADAANSEPTAESEPDNQAAPELIAAEVEETADSPHAPLPEPEEPERELTSEEINNIDDIINHLPELNFVLPEVPELQTAKYTQADLTGIVSAMLEDVLKDDTDKSEPDNVPAPETTEVSGNGGE